MSMNLRQDEQNPPFSLVVIIIIVVRFGAMVGKVFVAQTQVRRTQCDSNRSAWVDDVMTFLNIMT